MACGSIFDAFRVATEYLSPELYRRAAFNSALISAIPSGTYPKHVGTSVSVQTIEPNELGAEHTGGTAITQSAGATGAIENACSYAWTDLSVGFTEETYGPKQWGYRGPIFCKDSKYFEHNPDDFFEGYLRTMSDAVAQDLESFLFYHYARMVPIYVASATGFNALGTASTTLTASAATSELTQQMLDKLTGLLIADRSIPETADGSGLVSWGPSGPLWTLLADPEASGLILRNNADFRNDLRWADSGQGDGARLLHRIGVRESVKNYMHAPWILPQRFTHDGTKYVQVPRFVSSAATKGTKSTVNPNWINPNVAMYGAALILTPYVMRKEWVSPDNTLGGNSFEPQSYMGEWTWKTGPEALQGLAGDACYDPLHKFGRHLAEFKVAPAIGPNKRSGAIIFYRRCPNAATVVSCT